MNTHGEDIGSNTSDDGAAIEDLVSEPGSIIIRKQRTRDPDALLLGNSMAMAFPPPAADEHIIRSFSREPVPRRKDFESGSFSERCEHLSRLWMFHHLFQEHIDFIHKVVSVVRASFLARDPRKAEVIAFIWRIIFGARGEITRLTPLGGGGGLGFLVIGPSGVGKSSLIDRLVEYLRAMARIHLLLDGKPTRWKQLGVVRINVGESWRMTLLSILKEADRQLQMDHYSTRARTPSEAQLQGEVWSALTAHFCPLLILDEFQSLGEISEKKARPILKGLTDMMQTKGIPVMVVGTAAVDNLFQKFGNYFQKFNSGGPTRFKPLLPEDYTSDEVTEDAQVLLSTFKRMHACRKSPKYDEDFDKHFMAHTMGVARVMRDYFEVIHRKCAISEEEGQEMSVGRGLLDSIARNEMRMYEPAMDVLRKQRMRFPISMEDWKTYEHHLGPESVRTRELDAAYMEWLRKGQSAASEFPVEVYLSFQKDLRKPSLAATKEDKSSTPGEKALETRPKTSGVGGKEAPAVRKEEVAPFDAFQSAVLAAHSSRSQVTDISSPGPKKSPSRPAPKRSPSSILKELERSKRKTLKTPTKKAQDDGPPSVSPDELT